MRPAWPPQTSPQTRPSRRAPERCAWCGRPFDADSEILHGRRRCAACGVATTDPWPTPEELAAAYADWYRPREGRFSGIGDALLKRTRASLAGRLDRLAPPGRVLDVGAGDGSLLDALRARGRDAAGIEPHSTHPAVLDAELADLDGKYAAVVMWHSLEHLPEPGDALAQAARLLAPGGLLVVAVPNATSLQARVFGDRWLALDLPRHLVHIPARALVDRVRSAGMSIERVSYVRGGQVVFGWLHGMVAALPGQPDLYDAIRRPAARRAPLSPLARLGALAAAVVLLPAALVCAAVEVSLRRGGTVEVEARRG
jgi:SAM-dependent methyltransferase